MRAVVSACSHYEVMRERVLEATFHQKGHMAPGGPGEGVKIGAPSNFESLKV